MNNDFNFFVSCNISDDLFKSSYEAVGEDRYKNMYIEGLASDMSVDADNQVLEPQGFDFEDFKKSGMVNLEHFTTRKGDPAYWIGDVVDAYVKDDQFFVKSKLWEKRQLARNLWDTLLEMKASGSTRRAGYSIEGKTLLKDPKDKNRIKEAKMSHIAITFSPKNKNSWADIVKGGQSEDFIKSEIETIGDSKYVYTFMKGEKMYGVTKSFEIEEKEDEELEEKSDTTDSTSCLKKESLDKKIKKQIKAESLIKSLANEKINIKQAIFIAKSFKN